MSDTKTATTEAKVAKSTAKLPAKRLTDSEYARRRYEFAYRLRVVMVVAPGVIALLLIIIPPSFWNTLLPDIFARRPWNTGEIRTPLQIILLAVMLFATSALGVIMFYLQTGFKRDYREREQLREYELESKQMRGEAVQRDRRVIDELTDPLEQRLLIVEEALKTRATDLVQPDERQELLAQISSRLRGESIDELIADIERRVAERFVSSNRLQTVDSQFETSMRRLNGELTALGRRGNLNLGLGIVTTAAGLALLGYFVVQTATRNEELATFMVHFVPRFSVVLFMEVFAYFFLRLYKATLSEIKYFQNEMTNIESKFAALKTALVVDDAKSTAAVVQSLAKTERNYLLKKGESTVQIEQQRGDKELVEEITKRVTDAVVAITKR